MRMLRSLSVGLGLALTSVACLGDAEVVEPDARDALFDLAAFVDYQDSVLAGSAVRKRVRVGEGADETKLVTNVDWAMELAPFAGANVNKPALVDAYLLDRTEGEAPGQTTITLNAADSAERVRRIVIACASAAEDSRCPYAEVGSIYVETRFESVIADTEQRLRWRRDGYEVVSRQRVVGREERVLVVEGELVPAEATAPEPLPGQ